MATTKRDEMPSSTGGATDLSLGEGAEFEGKLTFKGTVRIDATFKGSIETDDVLIVGEHARIEADITCGTVIVHGQVSGNIRARITVELRSTCRVRGDLHTPSLSVEKGSSLQGTVRMEGTARPAVVRPPAQVATASAPASSPSAGLPA